GVIYTLSLHDALPICNAIERWGTTHQKSKYLRLLANESVGAYALSEPGSGSDAFALTTRAIRDGNGYRLSGRKLWITNAAEADVDRKSTRLNSSHSQI